MCGIAGILSLDNSEPVAERDIRQMLAMIRHRGPDEFGMYLDRGVGLGSARLSIIDLQTGQQPIPNEDRTCWVVFNGEVFNYLELRPELEAHGHRFATTSDTEVLVHAYEQWGPNCLERLNGQFAFAIWDARDRSLFLARDRLGVRPLFYSVRNGTLVFGSEIKCLFASGQIPAQLRPEALEQIFTFWSPLPPTTAFRNVVEVQPGHYVLAKNGEIQERAYWTLSFAEAGNGAQPVLPANSAEEYAESLGELLVDAARIRLRADVPVGAYLSGGLDSSIIASIIRNFTNNRLDTFSIAFDDTHFDESEFQTRMARFLGTEHRVVHATHADIGKVFPDVIWHTEVPIVRTAPAPMFMLSRLVRDSGYKVVLTGEGADEFLAGYDIFKEAKIRRFWAAEPGSRLRPLLLKRLYPDIAGLSKNSTALLAAFFGEGLSKVNLPEYSHTLRWRNGRRNCRFLRAELPPLSRVDGLISTLIPQEFFRWSPLSQAQFLEIKLFLSEYLLCSQGDRMGMAHSIEGRFPFLDSRLVEFCNRLPANLKLRALTEKYLLKMLGKKWLPPEIVQRRKRPYRAPINRSFFNEATPAYVTELLSPESLNETGYFKAQAVEHLVRKIQSGVTVSESDDMALAGILSTQLLHHQFIEHFTLAPTLSASDRVKVCRGNGAQERDQPLNPTAGLRHCAPSSP